MCRRKGTCIGERIGKCVRLTRFTCMGRSATRPNAHACTHSSRPHAPHTVSHRPRASAREEAHLSCSVPQAKVDWCSLPHDVGCVIVKHCWDIPVVGSHAVRMPSQRRVTVDALKRATRCTPCGKAEGSTCMCVHACLRQCECRHASVTDIASGETVQQSSKRAHGAAFHKLEFKANHKRRNHSCTNALQGHGLEMPSASVVRVGLRLCKNNTGQSNALTLLETRRWCI
jgi:hypothetical protein